MKQAGLDLIGGWGCFAYYEHVPPVDGLLPDLEAGCLISQMWTTHMVVLCRWARHWKHS
ncbi:MAG: hypothetical protein H8D32_00640 [Dehalococcoidia bacterium]|nr:hypothetical protein [Dehalococcoidia bacterium]